MKCFMEKESASFLIILICVVSPICSEGSFERLCASPFFFGEGEQKGLECTIKYKLASRDKKEAIDICERTFPYDLKDAKYGDPITTCTYEKAYKCEDLETAIDDRCFILKRASHFGDVEACGKKHTFHTIRSREELKWIAYLFYGREPEIWVANSAEDPTFLKPRSSKRIQGKTGLKVKLVPELNAPCGTVYYEDVRKRLPHLCSRPARAYETTIRHIHEAFTNLQYPGGLATDSKGGLRPFSALHLMIPVNGTNFEPDVKALHQYCSIFPNGYVASLNDFKDVDEYYNFQEALPAESHRTTVARMKQYNMEARSVCDGVSFFEANRKRWAYYGPLNSLSTTPYEHWTNTYPREYCSDHPRTTAVMQGQYEDMPAITRRPLLCTYGNPPNSPPLNPDDQCSKAAHFDKKLDRCVCNTPGADAKERQDSKYKHLPWGTVCLDCTSVNIKKSIVFILDNSGSVTADGWQAQKRFMLEVLNALKDIRVGLIIIEGHSYIKFRMDEFKNVEPKYRDFLENEPYGHKWTSVGVAVYHARTMLERETTDEKIIVIISDGSQDECRYDFTNDPCTAYKKQKIEEHSLEKEANKVHSLGIKVKYVLMDYWYDRSDEFRQRVHFLARSSSDIIRIKSYKKIEIDTVVEVVKRICRDEI